MMKAPHLTIFGVASPYAWDVVDTAIKCGWEVSTFDNFGGADPQLPALHTEAQHPAGAVAVGLSSAPGRAGAALAAFEAGFVEAVSLVDPFSSVASTATVRHGSLINAGAVVGSHSLIGCHANVNRSASIGHDNTIEFAASVGPGATLAGSVSVGALATIGAGAVVLPGRVIGLGAMVGAGAVVTTDVDDHTIVVGNPARVVRTDPGAVQGLVLTCPHC